ncbi:MAG: FeoA domain-containing protein, partial [Alistipes sp.]|nr:FeoA domain-containing protein [Alistipes sp.]
MRLSELKTGSSATILKVTGHGGFRRRIVEMGFIRGQRVEVVLNAPLKDPIEYRIMDYEVSLRRSEADMVVVMSDEEAARQLEEQQSYFAEEAPAESLDEVVARSTRTISVALVGNPNSGKTSLFNAISGGHEHVGNYSGVTVGAKCGVRHYRGYRFEVTDLPGTYALSAYTPEERYVREHLVRETPDVVINAVVASNLERNLYLTTELIDINPRMVVALNMFDELQSSGARLDYDALGRMLGVPMVPVEARNKRGIDTLLDTVIAVYEGRDDRVRHIHINQGAVIEEGLQLLNQELSA